ncbi:MAG: nucleotide exchange factor GrpE [Planctomycetota bacterium]
MKHKGKEKTKEQQQPSAKTEDVEKLQEQIKELQNEKDEIFGKLQRIGADYANFQKRVPKQIADTITYEKEKIIKTILPVLDNFEHTLQNVHSAESVDVLIKGIGIIYDQMLDILKSHGVEQIEALGQQFDPALHEAMMKKADPEGQENIVIEEFQKGYKLNGRVVRPTKAVVSTKSEEQDQQQEQTTDESEMADAE